MKKSRLEKGITLVSLIITIIILLILASVSIAAIKNDETISKAEKAERDFYLVQEKENLQREILKWSMVEIDSLENHLKDKLGEEKVQENEDGSITVEVESGNKYIVTEDGEVTLVGGTGVEQGSNITIALDKTSIIKEIESGSTGTENLTATLTNTTGNVTWSTSDASVAEVAGNGNNATVTLKAAGTATITASYGTISATCIVNVTEVVVELITFTIDDIEQGFVEYQAEKGMTWSDWVGSDYDTSNGRFATETLPSGSIILRYNGESFNDRKWSDTENK